MPRRAIATVTAMPSTTIAATQNAAIQPSNRCIARCPVAASAACAT